MEHGVPEIVLKCIKLCWGEDRIRLPSKKHLKKIQGVEKHDKVLGK
jgi:hypothetical protein